MCTNWNTRLDESRGTNVELNKKSKKLWTEYRKTPPPRKRRGKEWEPPEEDERYRAQDGVKKRNKQHNVLSWKPRKECFQGNKQSRVPNVAEHSGLLDGK